MKYQRLTKEQLEEMNREFATFLATQGIAAEEWEEIKKEKPEVAEEEIDLFSDVVWEKVLQKVKYLEHFSSQQIFLFKVEKDFIALIGIKLENETINLNTRQGYKWLQDNMLDDSVTLYKSRKALTADRNTDIFALIKQGANITKGELFEFFAKRLNTPS